MKQKQRDHFIAGEADAYFNRNRPALDSAETLAAGDSVLSVVKDMHPIPAAALEIGCANGWRLSRIQALGAQYCCGIDPSSAAVQAGKAAFPGLQLTVGTADSLPYPDAAFDLVVFGFCLYLCDPCDYFRIAFEADRVLRDEGHLVIFDFDPPSPYRNPYAHRPGIFSYKMDFSRLFLAHPSFQLRQKRVGAHAALEKVTPDNRIAVTWLVKSHPSGWPVNPWNAQSR